jgi:hypothetical protein
VTPTVASRLQGVSGQHLEDDDEPVTAVENLEEPLALAAEGADYQAENPAVAAVEGADGG